MWEPAQVRVRQEDTIALYRHLALAKAGNQSGSILFYLQYLRERTYMLYFDTVCSKVAEEHTRIRASKNSG